MPVYFLSQKTAQTQIPWLIDQILMQLIIQQFRKIRCCNGGQGIQIGLTDDIVYGPEEENFCVTVRSGHCSSPVNQNRIFAGQPEDVGPAEIPVADTQLMQSTNQLNQF